MNNRTLGTIAMICAPALLIEEHLLRGALAAWSGKRRHHGHRERDLHGRMDLSNTGMRRMEATGTGTWDHAALLIQLVGLVLAFKFGFFEATRLLGRESIVVNLRNCPKSANVLRAEASKVDETDLRSPVLC